MKDTCQLFPSLSTENRSLGVPREMRARFPAAAGLWVEDTVLQYGTPRSLQTWVLGLVSASHACALGKSLSLSGRMIVGPCCQALRDSFLLSSEQWRGPVWSFLLGIRGSFH